MPEHKKGDKLVESLKRFALLSKHLDNQRTIYDRASTLIKKVSGDGVKKFLEQFGEQDKHIAQYMLHALLDVYTALYQPYNHPYAKNETFWKLFIDFAGTDFWSIPQATPFSDKIYPFIKENQSYAKKDKKPFKTEAVEKLETNVVKYYKQLDTNESLDHFFELLNKFSVHLTGRPLEKPCTEFNNIFQKTAFGAYLNEFAQQKEVKVKNNMYDRRDTEIEINSFVPWAKQWLKNFEELRQFESNHQWGELFISNEENVRYIIKLLEEEAGHVMTQRMFFFSATLKKNETSN